eukprot:1574422-Heterocapsa_arctica.AAC.1
MRRGRTDSNSYTRSSTLKVRGLLTRMPPVLADVIHTHVAGLRLNSAELWERTVSCFPLKELAEFQLAPGSRTQFPT